MKILKNNFSITNNTYKQTPKIKPYPRKLVCQECESELEYDEEDLVEGVYGCMHINCPLCGYNNILEESEHNITVTKDNVKFPTHFHHTSVETGAVDNCNNEFVKSCVKEAITYLRENKDNKDGDYCYVGTGSTMIYVFRYDEDENYEVVVTDNYYHTYINFESEDYID